jgi:preprotein translocase subunit SecY
MNAQILILLVMVTGSLVVVWLANRNEEKGLGGITMFILYQIVITALRNFSTFTNVNFDEQHKMMIAVIAATCVIVLILTIVAGNAELRLHVNKIGIDSGYTGKSYLPIKLNPAGASPIMYGLTVLTMPQFIIHALSLLFPNISTGVDRFLSYWTLSSFVGFLIYLVLLFVLTIFFGLFTVSPKETSEQMKNSGDYFDFVPPGAPTKKYLRKRVVILSMISGVFLVIFTGLPLYFVEIDWNLSFLFMLPGTVMMFVSLLLVIREEIADIRIGTKYSSIFFK